MATEPLGESILAPRPPRDWQDQELGAWLVGALARRAPDFQGAIEAETPLADGGLCLDSLALVDLIAEIGQTLGVSVREEEITAEHFGTVWRLLGFLEARLR